MTTTTTAEPFVDELDRMIHERRKMTSPLYRRILAGEASQGLLRAFVVHRYPIKALWTRNILGIASRVESYALRRELVENIYEEETGALTGDGRHLDTFVEVGLAVGLSREEIVDGPVLPQTRAVMEHNVRSCNSADVPVTDGVASVLLLMEGQPSIVDDAGASMDQVMREVYGLPPRANAFFVHHASSTDGAHASELEDDHAGTARALLRALCDTPERRESARAALATAIELRHRHFDAVLALDPGGPPFRYGAATVLADRG